MNFVYYIKEYQTLFGTIIGSFLAIISSVSLWTLKLWHDNRREVRGNKKEIERIYMMALRECGFYDPEGKKDEHKIRGLINDYLFNICFNPDKPENVEYFIDYLFRNFAHAFASAREDGLSYVPSINEFTKVLDKDKLAKYWTQHKKAIKAMNLEAKEKIIPLGDNHEASYKKYIPLIYDVLDNHADSYTKDDKQL